MSTECYPITVLPHVTQLYRDYLAMAENPSVFQWYGGNPFGSDWMRTSTVLPGRDPAALADALHAQSAAFGAGTETLANIEKLRRGARAVVTGQQVGLFGGPLLTLLKAATAVARAKDATAATGMEHVPVFWLATEDHDLAEVNQAVLLSKNSAETISVEFEAGRPSPVGATILGSGIAAALDRASDLLGYAPVCDLLREFYTPEATLGGSFARLMTHIFRSQGLIVMDAAGREFHALGAPVLRAVIDQAAGLEDALLQRSNELEQLGYHAQVLVKPNTSLLFLLDAETGERLALRRLPDGGWKAGNKPFEVSELHRILETAPERISPNALLRPVFQDAMLPTTAYIGGPAEIAYFAQSAVLYQNILGRITPVLPRLSATLVEPALAAVMADKELSLPDVLTATDTLAQRLGARAMPIEAKRKLASAGNAMETELAALTQYLSAMDETLGRTAAVSGSKMLYQMNRLRRMTATFQLQKESGLRKQAEALTLNLFPNAHPQERLLAGIWFLARHGDGLIERLVDEARNVCPGHLVIRL